MLADFHLHSNMSYDNTHGPTIGQIMHKANQLGLQAISITDHNQVFDSRENQHYIPSYDILPVSGTEISCPDGHLIVLGLHHRVRSYQLVQTAIDDLRQEDVIIIAAHPFDPKYGVNDRIYHLDIDAIEINGRRDPKINQMAKQTAEELDLPLVGSSDAHQLYDMGTTMTLLDCHEYSEEAVITAIRAGRTKVVHSRT